VEGERLEYYFPAQQLNHADAAAKPGAASAASAAAGATDSNTARIPQDLTPFINNGTITQAILDDPNTILRNIVSQQRLSLRQPSSSRRHQPIRTSA
jgi:hypothetical protein